MPHITRHDIAGNSCSGSEHTSIASNSSFRNPSKTAIGRNKAQSPISLIKVAVIPERRA